ncbi:transmembrane protein 156 [Lissotriton helveticus]
MCRAGAKSTLTKLLTAVGIMFIICLPELFKTREGSTMVMLCSEVCTQDKISYLLSSENLDSLVCLLQQIPHNKTVFLRIYLNYTRTATHSALGTCGNTSHEMQPTDRFVCQTEGSVSSFYHQLRSQESKSKGSLELNRKNTLRVLKHFHFTTYSAVETICESSALLLQIDFSNSTQSEHASMGNSSFSQVTRLVEDGFDCINVSLHLESSMSSSICTVWVVWLVLILFVFLLALNIITYKVLQENNESLARSRYGHRLELAVIRASEHRPTTDIRRAKTPQALSGETHRRRSSSFAYLNHNLAPIPEYEALHCIDSEMTTRNSVIRYSEQELEEVFS